ncbi:FGGY family carbohydrate kinase [Halobellus limi]|jgi:glycerol kinase|uniref:ATP:glycerol 3-phosphotransferase n=1 Tax=Halobellus limi TaxID=699433 RepID=A0A1H5SLK6_9EURY|nr:FGGY family carbohydrate kinase [Halobellus limi]QCC47554.1 glycerol kinase [Halobellus limi]SEF51456.1 glycerol kinase [Halobellus limi]
MSGTSHLGALDQGTSGTRFVIFDESGTPISEAFTGHQPQTAGAGRIEYDPLRLWGCATDAIRRGLAGADLDAAELRALGISSQRQTVLLWDAESGRPCTSALSWRDRRTTAQIQALDDEERRLIRDRTGLEPDAYFAAPKIKWLLDEGGDGAQKAGRGEQEAGRSGERAGPNGQKSGRSERRADRDRGADADEGAAGHDDGRRDADLRERAARGEVLLGTVDSWLCYNLTGRHVTDVTNAAQTMLFDIRGREWDDDLLALFDVPRPALPTVRPSSDPEGFGVTDPDGVLNAAVPVTGVMGDQQAALLGRVACTESNAKVTYGTGNFFLQNTGTEPVEADGELLTTIWFQRAGEDPYYGLEGPVFATGAVLEWLRTVGLLEDAAELDQPGCTEREEAVHFVPAFGGLGAPDWVPGARGGVFGLHRDTDRDDVLRAAVEAIGFGTRAVVEAAEAATGVAQDRLLVDGGAIQNDEFAQCQADLIDRPLVRSNVTQTTALGACFAAGLAAGVWGSLDDLEPCRPNGRTFSPTGDSAAVTDAYRRWRDVVETVARMS